MKRKLFIQNKDGVTGKVSEVNGNFGDLGGIYLDYDEARKLCFALNEYFGFNQELKILRAKLRGLESHSEFLGRLIVKGE